MAELEVHILSKLFSQKTEEEVRRSEARQEIRPDDDEEARSRRWVNMRKNMRRYMLMMKVSLEMVPFPYSSSGSFSHLFRTCMPILLSPAAGRTNLSSEFAEICVIDFDMNQLRRNARENWKKY